MSEENIYKIKESNFINTLKEYTNKININDILPYLSSSLITYFAYPILKKKLKEKLNIDLNISNDKIIIINSLLTFFIKNYDKNLSVYDQVNNLITKIKNIFKTEHNEKIGGGINQLFDNLDEAKNKLFQLINDNETIKNFGSTVIIILFLCYFLDFNPIDFLSNTKQFIEKEVIDNDDYEWSLDEKNKRYIIIYR